MAASELGTTLRTGLDEPIVVAALALDNYCKPLGEMTRGYQC